MLLQVLPLVVSEIDQAVTTVVDDPDVPVMLKVIFLVIVAPTTVVVVAVTFPVIQELTKLAGAVGRTIMVSLTFSEPKLGTVKVRVPLLAIRALVVEVG